jgi:CheY-like chemotaxis protein
MRRLKDICPGIAGICLSGYGTEEDLRACREAGFSEHLTKPVDMGRLHAAVARATSALEHAKGG